MSRADVDDEKRYLLTNVIDIYLDLDGEDEERFDREIDKEERKEVKKMVLTWQEALADREAKGKTLGETIGEVREARKAILLVSEHRWGSPPEEFVDKLEAVDDLERLHEILEQGLKVGSLDEIDV